MHPFFAGFFYWSTDAWDLAIYMVFQTWDGTSKLPMINMESDDKPPDFGVPYFHTEPKISCLVDLDEDMPWMGSWMCTPSSVGKCASAKNHQLVASGYF